MNVTDKRRISKTLVSWWMIAAAPAHLVAFTGFLLWIFGQGNHTGEVAVRLALTVLAAFWIGVPVSGFVAGVVAHLRRPNR